MTAWKPGTPVMTDQDHADWVAWRSERKRQQQRARRARCRRIDYYPDRDAGDLIRSMSGRFAGEDLSSVINRIVGEWADRCRPTPGGCTRAVVPPE